MPSARASNDRPVEAPADRPAGPARADRAPDRSFGDAMTDPQRRLLYRIAFEKGHEGDGARDWLHGELGVTSLADVSKRQASAFIDRHLDKRGNGHAAAG